jgi:hypothetical protein
MLPAGRQTAGWRLDCPGVLPSMPLMLRAAGCCGASLAWGPPWCRTTRSWHLHCASSEAASWRCGCRRPTASRPLGPSTVGAACWQLRNRTSPVQLASTCSASGDGSHCLDQVACATPRCRQRSAGRPRVLPHVRRSPEQGRRRGRAQPAPEARQRSSARAADGTARPCGQPQQPAHRAPARDRLQHRGRQVGDELARGHARCAWPESDWLHAVRGGHRRGSTGSTRYTGLLAAAGTCCARWWTPRWARWRPQAA